MLPHLIIYLKGSYIFWIYFYYSYNLFLFCKCRCKSNAFNSENHLQIYCLHTYVCMYTIHRGIQIVDFSFIHKSIRINVRTSMLNNAQRYACSLNFIRRVAFNQPTFSHKITIFDEISWERYRLHRKILNKGAKLFFHSRPLLQFSASCSLIEYTCLTLIWYREALLPTVVLSIFFPSLFTELRCSAAIM